MCNSGSKSEIMDTTLSMKEGFISFRGYKVWYGIVGEREEPGRLPLLCLHGGPGAPHDYLEPISGMAKTGRRVVFYDQQFTRPPEAGAACAGYPVQFASTCTGPLPEFPGIVTVGLTVASPNTPPVTEERQFEALCH